MFFGEEFIYNLLYFKIYLQRDEVFLLKILLILTIIFGIDFSTKWYANQNLPIEKKKKVCKKDGNFLFEHMYWYRKKNKGFAYHCCSEKRNLILWSTGCMILVYSYIFCRHLYRKETVQATALAILLGGALGNFYERLIKGSVTDFIYIERGRNAPIFNFADIFIVLGFFVYSLKQSIEK